MRVSVGARVLEGIEELRVSAMAGLWTAIQMVAVHIPARQASERLYDLASWRRYTYLTRRTRRERRLLRAWARRQPVRDPWA